MIGAVYRWIGLGVGTMCVLLAGSALAQELHGPVDWGSVAFDVIFGLFTGGIAATSGYALLKDRRSAAGGGCLIIVLVTGALVFATGSLLFLLSIDSTEPPPPQLVGILVALGLVMLVPSGLLLWRQRARHG